MILGESSQPRGRALDKIKFLEAEKRELNEYIADLQESLRLNKSALHQMTDLLNHQLASDDKLLLLSQAVKSISEENQALREMTSKLRVEVESYKCQSLIGQQIKQEMEKEYQAIIKHYDIKIMDLRRTIQEKEYIIQEKETGKTELINDRSSGSTPRQDLVRMQTLAEENLELIKKLSTENNQLKSQGESAARELLLKSILLDRFERLIRTSNGYYCLKQLLKRGIEKRSMSTDYTRGRSLPRKEEKPSSMESSNRGKGQEFPVQIAATLRRLLFQSRRNSELLARELSELTVKFKSLWNTNRLLTESNINYQNKRSQIKAELCYYQHKCSELLNQATRGKATQKHSSLDRAISKHRVQTVASTLTTFPVPQSTVVPTSRNRNIGIFMMESSRVWSNSIFRHASFQKTFKRSLSCVDDHIFSFEQNLESNPKPRRALPIVEQSVNDPFLLDCSAIKPCEDFGDISACFKRASNRGTLRRGKEDIRVF